ncbi:MAG: amino acid aldolase [Gammaproteobacteria bacterium]|nr:amino acid aldolase [Gammaproteobacteria bacterium]
MTFRHTGMRPLRLDGLLEQPIAVGTKGLPLRAAGLRLREIGRQNWNLLAGDVTLPAAVLRDSALRHNSATMSAFVRTQGVSLAPHGKTTMAPQLFQRQLADGARALTAATPAHIALYRSVGVSRIIYANQLVDRPVAAFLVAELIADPQFELLCLVDSLPSAQLLAKAVRDAGSKVRIDVLIEVGMAGGRTGLRTVAEAEALARLIASELPELRLRGVEAFEGVVGFDAAGRAKVDGLLDAVVQVTRAIRPLVPAADPIISAGGSAFFPWVVERLRREGPGFDIILRSGCYLAHDHGMYSAGQASAHCHQSLWLDPPLEPALEIWAQVQSLPEPGFAYLNVGKRDISHDAGLPLPIKWSPQGTREIRPLNGDYRILQLNDQHAFMAVPATHPLEVGDRVALGCSHPCTTFDKWRVLLVTDDEYGIVEGIATCF